MRLLPLTLLCGFVAGSAPALAQVSVDSHALDSLGAAAPAHPAQAPAHTPPRHTTAAERRAAAHPARTTHPEHGHSEPGHPEPAARTAAARPGTARSRTAPPGPARMGTPPTIAAAPPAPAALPPVAALPSAHPAPPPPPIPVVADAPGVASQLPGGGARVTFGADRADLNPATAAAIRAVAEALRSDPDATVDVIARAAGTPDDPSTPRRLSLARALAARSVLIGAGIPSERIFPRALGSTAPDDGPPDRVDVARTAAPARLPVGVATPAAATARPATAAATSPSVIAGPGTAAPGTSPSRTAQTAAPARGAAVSRSAAP